MTTPRTFWNFAREFLSFWQGRLQESGVDLIPDTVLPVYSCDRAVRFSRAVASRRTGPAGSGGRKAVSCR